MRPTEVTPGRARRLASDDVDGGAAEEPRPPGEAAPTNEADEASHRDAAQRDRGARDAGGADAAWCGDAADVPPTENACLPYAPLPCGKSPFAGTKDGVECVEYCVHADAAGFGATPYVCWVQGDAEPSMYMACNYCMVGRAHGVTPILFVRETKKDARGLTAPYEVLGPVDVLRWRGERPIQVVWKLRVPMTAAAFAEARIVA